MIDHVTGLFKMTECDDKRVISMASLVGTTWVSRYTRPIEITYGRGS